MTIPWRKHSVSSLLIFIVACSGSNSNSNPVIDQGISTPLVEDTQTATTLDPGQVSTDNQAPRSTDSTMKPPQSDPGPSSTVETKETDTMPPLPIRYLALGDSYTIGQNVPVSERWPVHLSGLLNSNDLPTLAPEIIAQTGWTTANLKQAIIDSAPQGPFDLVTLLIGVNNQYQGLSIDTFRVEFKELLNTALNFAGDQTKRLIVLTIPDYGITPFAATSDSEKIAAELALFNQIVIEESTLIGLTLVDIRDIWLQALNDPTLIADDGLHPSGAMYALWAQAVLPKALKSLKP